MNKATAGSVAFAAALVFVLSVTSCSENAGTNSTAEAGTNAAMLIEPGVAVGKIHLGMSKAQVVAEIGPPGRQTANSLEYPRLGLAVMPNADGMVQVVMCGDVMGINGPFAKAFKGRTKEGIGMKSTREEVLKAFGEPAAHEKMPLGIESMTYASLGLTFTLEDGKVYHIIVRLKAREPDRTISIEPAPTK